MTNLISTQIHSTIGVIRMTRKPVNALGHGLREAISKAHHTFESNPTIATIVLTGQGRFFSAGADITEFDTARRAPLLTDLIAQIEASKKPVFALVNGIAYGGGFELALGCHGLAILPEAKFAFPEINLGNIPGAGGTQKLPRLIGGPAALEIILSGKPISAARAVKLGVARAIDATQAEAITRIEGEWSNALSQRLPRDLAVKGSPNDLAEVAAPFLRRARGAPAATKVVEAVRMAYDTPIGLGLAWENETFHALNTSPEAKALRHIFFAERKSRKIADAPPQTPQRSLASAGVIGVGIMGAGIATCLADAGLWVTVIEQQQGHLDQGLARIRAIYDEALRKGRISKAEADERLARITGSVSMYSLAKVDMVVEAVHEAMDIKCSVFATLDKICKPGAILATNTSTLDVNEIAAATSRPEDVIGLHFFSPAHIMKLLEVVRANYTAPDVIATAMALGPRLGKVPVLVGVCNGFAGNRMFINFNREAQILVEEGALPWQIDSVLTDWGLAMGPLAVMDLAGLDVGYRIRQARGPQSPYPFTIADRLAEAGYLGQKTGRGWYLYPEGTRRGQPDPEVEKLIKAVAHEKGITQRQISNEEILQRCLWQLVNTGYQIVEEGIAQRLSDLDVIFINGYGFPKTRGGPMFFAEQTGLARIAADVRQYHAEIGQHWKPSALLLEMADKAVG